MLYVDGPGRNWKPSEPTIFRGHLDGISSFSVWGQDVISISRNKIGVSSLSKFGEEEGSRHGIIAQKLYIAKQGTRNVKILSSISILSFSRFFVRYSTLKFKLSYPM